MPYSLEEKEDIRSSIETLLEMDDVYLKTALLDLHPADIAEMITGMELDKRIRIFDAMDKEYASGVMVELDTPLRVDLIENLDNEHVVDIIRTMDSDDAADVIAELDEEKAKRILEAMPWKEFREVKTLLHHGEETAGGIMALEVVSVMEDSTAQQALQVLRKKAEEVDDVYHIYVTDSKGVLKGSVSLKTLVLSKPRTKISEIMEKDPAHIKTDWDQEHVAQLFHKYDLVSAPVVDGQGRLIGRITVDDVLDVLEEEASEDINMMAGITDEVIGTGSIFKISYVRLPWLLVAFAGEIISAMVLRNFEASLGKIFTAAFFIPMIMAMGGNTGIQSATIVIRGLATGEIQLRDTGKRLIREMGAALINGIVISLLLLVVVSLWLGDYKFGIVLALAIIAVLFNAALIGTLIPFILKRIGVDPAIATGPFISSSNDILGLLMYFGVITLFQNWF